MNLYQILAFLVGAGGLGCAAWLGARLLSYRRFLKNHSNEGFTPERYQAMPRLLASDDVEFLASQPGTTRDDIREFERDRRKIFREYLGELAGDFQSLHARAREFAAVAPEEHAELIGDLLKKQVEFWLQIARLEVQLAVAPLGVRVDTRPIMDLIAALGRSSAVLGPVPVN